MLVGFCTFSPRSQYNQTINVCEELYLDTGIVTGYGPVTSVNRPVRTRMPGGVGAGGKKPPATRLNVLFSLLY